MLTGKLRWLPLTFCLFCVFAHAQEAKLVPGQPIEREISGGQSHSYSISLSQGQFVRVVVEQKGLDVAVALNGPDDKRLIQSDVHGTAGVPLSFEVKVAGNYYLEVRSNDLPTLKGTYKVLTELKATATVEDRTRMTAEQLLNDAVQMRRQKDWARSIEKQQPALTLWRELEDRPWEADTLRLIGNNYASLSRHDKAIEYYEQVLAIRRTLKDRSGEGYSLADLGRSYESLGRFDKSLESFTQALAINQEIGNRRQEGVDLNWIGWLNQKLTNYEKALDYSHKALSIAREMKNRDDEGSAIDALANTYSVLGQTDKAIGYGEQYLAIERELKNRDGEASALNNLALFYGAKLQYEKAVEYFEQALALFREQKDRQTEALALRNLGNLYVASTRLDKAVESYELALPIYREIKDRQGEALTLGPLANAYSQLGRQDKAIEYFELALPINREFKNTRRESGNLNGLGNAYLQLGNYEKAIEYYEQALALGRKMQAHPNYIATLLGNIGDAYIGLGRNEKAIEYAQQALDILRETKTRSAETHPLLILGDAFRAQGQYPQATMNDEQALRLAREIKNRLREGDALFNLMQDWDGQKKPTLAIFFGKQAVNFYQEIRSEITGLDRQTQQSFVKSNEQTYRKLADLLIGQARLPEAEQVIRMLKDEEYFEFIRRDNPNAPQTDKAQLTSEEQALDKRYREIADQLASLGAERGALIDRKNRTPEEEKRLAKLDDDLTVAGNAFQKFLDQLTTTFGSSRDTSGKVFQLRESQGLMEDLRDLGKGTVALYTLVGEDKYRVILTTADFQKGYEYPIKASDLNRKILEFREVLQNPRLDPLPLARELYKILIGPFAKDLQSANATTLMWSLDGVLRYLPVSALHDGKQYMVEVYNSVVFTPASQARLKDIPAGKWDALGLGVTKAHGARIPALPGVIEEMQGIIREDGARKATGVLPGVVKLDEQFTEETMLAELRKRHKVVHIASHFQFSPGDETNSALLLGDGSFLSLAQIKALPNIFSGVDLLTLSACNTATGGAANGKEVEGFGVLAQRQGAKAVIASLWPVSDVSTKVLMQEFYRLRESRNGTTKIEALRQAQLELQRGTQSSAAASSAANDRQIVHEEPKPDAANRPLFKLDPKAPYSHPYYWAPFILIGNWR